MPRLTDEAGVSVSSTYRTFWLASSSTDLVREHPDVVGVPHEVDDGQVDVDEPGEIGEREVLGEQRLVGRHRRGALVAGGQLGDDAGRRRSDVVNVQLDLGESGDERGHVGHPAMVRVDQRDSASITWASDVWSKLS